MRDEVRQRRKLSNDLADPKLRFSLRSLQAKDQLIKIQFLWCYGGAHDIDNLHI